MPPDASHFPLTLVAVAVLALVIAGLVAWLVLRLRYKRRVRAHGWTFITDPGYDSIRGLNCPPFGLGGDAVRCTDDRFGYDVIHPQMMEWLLGHPAPHLAIEGGRIRFEVPDISVATLEGCLGFAAGFFGRVRRYTWENLGLRAPPVPSIAELDPR